MFGLKGKIVKSSLIKTFKRGINLTHTGPSKMVNVGEKNDTLRYARAMCKVKTKKEVIDLIVKNQNAKGDVLRVAEIAGIMGAKKTHELVI
jgi:molybdenum cofactor biosynthesis enzyme